MSRARQSPDDDLTATVASTSSSLHGLALLMEGAAIKSHMEMEDAKRAAAAQGSRRVSPSQDWPDESANAREAANGGVGAENIGGRFANKPVSRRGARAEKLSGAPTAAGSPHEEGEEAEDHEQREEDGDGEESDRKYTADVASRPQVEDGDVEDGSRNYHPAMAYRPPPQRKMKVGARPASPPRSPRVPKKVKARKAAAYNGEDDDTREVIRGEPWIQQGHDPFKLERPPKMSQELEDLLSRCLKLWGGEWRDQGAYLEHLSLSTGLSLADLSRCLTYIRNRQISAYLQHNGGGGQSGYDFPPHLPHARRVAAEMMEDPRAFPPGEGLLLYKPGFGPHMPPNGDYPVMTKLPGSGAMGRGPPPPRANSHGPPPPGAAKSSRGMPQDTQRSSKRNGPLGPDPHAGWGLTHMYGMPRGMPRPGEVFPPDAFGSEALLEMASRNGAPPRYAPDSPPPEFAYGGHQDTAMGLGRGGGQKPKQRAQHRRDNMPVAQRSLLEFARGGTLQHPEPPTVADGPSSLTDMMGGGLPQQNRDDMDNPRRNPRSDKSHSLLYECEESRAKLAKAEARIMELELENEMLRRERESMIDMMRADPRVWTAQREPNLRQVQASLSKCANQLWE